MGQAGAVGGEIYGIRLRGRGPGGRTGSGQGGRDRALAAAGQDGPVAVVRAGQAVEVVDGAALFLAGQLGLADRPGTAAGSLPGRGPGQGGGGRPGRVCRPARLGRSRLSSAPKTVPKPGAGLLAAAAWANCGTPYMPSWSVRARATRPRSAASATRSAGLDGAVKEAVGRVAVQLGPLGPPVRAAGGGAAQAAGRFGCGSPAILRGRRPSSPGRRQDSRRSNSRHGIGGLSHPIGRRRCPPLAVSPAPVPVPVPVMAGSTVVAGLERPAAALDRGQPGGSVLGDQLEPGAAAARHAVPPAFGHRPGPGPGGDREPRAAVRGSQAGGAEIAARPRDLTGARGPPVTSGGQRRAGTP